MFSLTPHLQLRFYQLPTPSHHEAPRKTTSFSNPFLTMKRANKADTEVETRCKRRRKRFDHVNYRLNWAHTSWNWPNMRVACLCASWRRCCSSLWGGLEQWKRVHWHRSHAWLRFWRLHAWMTTFRKDWRARQLDQLAQSRALGAFGQSQLV